MAKIVDMGKLRWESYVLVPNNELDNFCSDYFGQEKKILFIIGKGFDARMNFALKKLLNSPFKSEIECLIIDFNEGVNSPSHEYDDVIKSNFEELNNLLLKKYKELKIESWIVRDRQKRYIGDRDIAEKIFEYEIESYSDIIIDISSLPRSIYFPLVGALLKKTDLPESKCKNLFVTVTENTEIDKQINARDTDEDIRYIHGYSGGSNKIADEKPLIYFPILGEKKLNDLKKLYTQLNPKEVCPILPFPSKNPRRSDALIMEYHESLFDELQVEPQNIIYVPEQNPFEVYRILSKAIDNYNKSLEVFGGCKVVLTAFSSKLLTLGVLMTAFENEKNVGVANLQSRGYIIDDVNSLKNSIKSNEVFLIWLNGEAYEK
jgi:hypothetical protein